MATDGTDPLAAWRAMLLAHSRALRAIESDLGREGTVPLTWYDVLLELHGAGGRSRMQALGERVVLSRTRVSRLVDDMERDGLVRREPDPSDGRVTFAVITDAGESALRRAAPAYKRLIEEHFNRHLTDEERTVIATALDRVRVAHEAGASR